MIMCVVLDEEKILWAFQRDQVTILPAAMIRIVIENRRNISMHVIPPTS